MTTQEQLRAAAARVRRGWCQMILDDGEGNVCAMGALAELSLQRVVGPYAPPGYFWCELTDLYYGPAARAVVEALGLVPVTGSQGVLHYGETVADWNNQPDQTAENVAAGLEFAALWLDEKEKLESDDDAGAVRGRVPAAVRGVRGIAGGVAVGDGQADVPVAAAVGAASGT